MRAQTWRRRSPVGGAAMCLGGMLAACSGSVLPLDVPPMVLTPAKLAGLKDDRGRFREVYCGIRAHHGTTLADDLPCEEAIVTLANEPPGTDGPVPVGAPRGHYRIAVVPGILAECVSHQVKTLSDALGHLDQHGYRTGIIPVGGRSGIAHNAAQIRDYVMKYPANDRFILVAHSKGAADSLEALMTYQDVAARVAALVSVAGAVGGSPLGDDLAPLYDGLLANLNVLACEPGDGKGPDDLRRESRWRALTRAVIPSSVKYFSLAGIVDRTHVSRVLQPAYDRLARIDSRNDGQVIFSDAIIPGARLLGYVRADHWALAVPFNKSKIPFLPHLIDKNAFPREVLLEAIVRTVEEVLDKAGLTPPTLVD